MALLISELKYVCFKMASRVQSVGFLTHGDAVREVGRSNPERGTL